MKNTQEMLSIFQMVQKYDSISIIGMNKNVGKTTTLNHILKEARQTEQKVLFLESYE